MSEAPIETLPNPWKIMETIDAGKLLTAVGGMTNLAHIVRDDNFDPLQIPLRNHEMLCARIKWVCEELERVGLGVSLRMATQLKEVIEKETEPYTGAPNHMGIQDWVQFGFFSRQRFRDFSKRLLELLSDELSARIVLSIPVEKESYYNPTVPVFGKEVVDKFPNQTSDMFEAGNCFAVGRYTACVFHLMRIMESAVQIFGTKLGVPLANELNWQDILNRLNPVIKRMDHHLPLTKQYALIQAHLYNVKVAQRNEVMHPKATYNEEEARSVLNATRVFLSDLAKAI